MIGRLIILVLGLSFTIVVDQALGQERTGQAMPAAVAGRTDCAAPKERKALWLPVAATPWLLD